MDGVVVGRDRADDAGGLLLDPAMVAARERVAVAEILDEVVSVEEIRVPTDDVGRARELGPGHARHRRADLVHEDLAQWLEVVDQGLVELAKAAHAELVVA